MTKQQVAELFLKLQEDLYALGCDRNPVSYFEDSSIGQVLIGEWEKSVTESANFLKQVIQEDDTIAILTPFNSIRVWASQFFENMTSVFRGKFKFQFVTEPSEQTEICILLDGVDFEGLPNEKIAQLYGENRRNSKKKILLLYHIVKPTDVSSVHPDLFDGVFTLDVNEATAEHYRPIGELLLTDDKPKENLRNKLSIYTSSYYQSEMRTGNPVFDNQDCIIRDCQGRDLWLLIDRLQKEIAILDFDYGWSFWDDLPEILKYRQKRGILGVFGREGDTTLMGYIVMNFESKQQSEFSIKYLQVFPEYQNQGYGSLLIKAGEDACILRKNKNAHSVVITVLPSQDKARFYEKLGYINKPGDHLHKKSIKITSPQ